jgi:Fibronectin type III domain.
MTNAIHRRILAFALAVATVIAFTPAIAFTQSASAATRPGKVSWASESKTQTTITLNWKKASKASGYSVYQKKSGKYVKVKNTGNRTYTVKKLKASKTYKFYVKAYRTSHGKNIYGKRSSVKTVTT